MILKPNGNEIYGISNGAIWAIWIELQIYVIAVLCKKVLISNCSKTFWRITFACAFLINLIGNELVSLCQNNGFGIVAKIYSSSFLPYLYFFLIGVLGYKFKDSVIRFICNNLIYITVAFLAWHLLIKYHVEPLAEAGYYTDPITVLLAGMLTLGLAFRFGKCRLKVELSYGIYVWHMPIITFLIQVISGREWLLILISMVLTFMFAVLSNIFIEKKVQKIESHILQRGVFRSECQ